MHKQIGSCVFLAAPSNMSMVTAIKQTGGSIWANRLRIVTSDVRAIPLNPNTTSIRRTIIRVRMPVQVESPD